MIHFEHMIDRQVAVWIQARRQIDRLVSDQIYNQVEDQVQRHVWSCVKGYKQ